MPDAALLVEKLLRRRTFRPDPQGSNLMFAFFAQHFTHQFFKTYNRMGLGFTKALGHGHLSGYLLRLKFDPTLLFDSPFQYGNRIALEFSQLYHWHPLMPDSFHIAGDELPYSQFLFNSTVLTHYGVEKLVDAFSRQRAGQVTEATPPTFRSSNQVA
ncbi:unnamed protein product [Menidia menidia]|uniref:(Atlantic silverside) hypothetical protein n=1 Tax=Menidia menidia TaxID=238744 RepID=A0A8S4AU47_9TELE|nr:unnamed protein product [Menidia menidia]